MPSGYQADRQSDEPERSPERKIYGVNACRAFFKVHPKSVIRAYLGKEMAGRMGDVMKFCAENKKAYHLVDTQELEKITKSKHHEGICFLVRGNPVSGVAAFLSRIPAGQPCCVLAVEKVGNPHNIGGLMRLMAHFQADALLTEDASQALSGAAVRTAEGGADWVRNVACHRIAQALPAFRSDGFEVLATSSHEGEDVFSTPLPSRCLILLGSEGEGLSQGLFDAADRLISIPGSGRIESLNVATAAGILLGQWFATHRTDLEAVPEQSKADKPQPVSARKSSKKKKSSRYGAGKMHRKGKSPSQQEHSDKIPFSNETAAAPVAKKPGKLSNRPPFFPERDAKPRVRKPAAERVPFAPEKIAKSVAEKTAPVVAKAEAPKPIVKSVEAAPVVEKVEAPKPIVKSVEAAPVVEKVEASKPIVKNVEAAPVVEKAEASMPAIENDASAPVVQKAVKRAKVDWFGSKKD